MTVPVPAAEASPTPRPVVFVETPAPLDERPDPQSPVVEAPSEVVPEGCWEGAGQRWTIEAGDDPHVVLSPSGRRTALQYRASDRLFGFETRGRHEGLMLFRLEERRIQAYPHYRRGRGQWRRSGGFVLTRC